MNLVEENFTTERCAHVSNRVFVLDKNKQPLMPCTPVRARVLLSAGKAAVFRRAPFTIILTHREGGDTQGLTLKIDPGSKTTGIALVADFAHGPKVIFAAAIKHKGQAVKQSLDARRASRRSRRQRHARYRPWRFDNRRRPVGWLPPSLRSRIGKILTWLKRLARRAPILAVAMELIKFDLQGMENPEISGAQYQQGTLLGYEVREYLLEKFQRTCAYCNSRNVPLQVEHIVPRSRGGVDSVGNLTLACTQCNQKKGNQTALEFGHPEVEKLARAPLKDAAAINASRWALWRELTGLGYRVECGSGGRTKFNRTIQGYPKAHWIDAACVGQAGQNVRLDPKLLPLSIKAVERGTRQSCRTNKFGFPIRHCLKAKRSYGFQTGDMVQAVIPSGKYAGTHVGRVTIRHQPTFQIKTVPVHHRHLTLLQRSDGYDYAGWTPHPAGVGPACGVAPQA